MSEETKGVRMACPQCTLDCVMVAEGELPERINKLVEGVPWCPNCDLPMKPVGSVNGADRPTAVVVPDDATFAERLEQIRQAQTEVDAAKSRWARAAMAAKDMKKEWDDKVTSLGSLIRRITQVPAPLPLFDGVASEATSTGTSDELAEFVQRLAAVGVSVTRDRLDGLSSTDFLAVEAFVKGWEAGDGPQIPRCLFPSQAATEPADEVSDDDHDDQPTDEAPPEQPPARRRRGRKSQDAHA